MPRSHAEIFAALLQNLYHDLLDLGIPDEMAVLVRRLTAPPGPPGPAVPRLAMVADPDPRSRVRASALFREAGLQPVGCAGLAELFDALESYGPEVALVFADDGLTGRDRWFGLAFEIAATAPLARIVVALGPDAPRDALPAGLVRMTKPWHGLDVLIEGSRALGRPLDS